MTEKSPQEGTVVVQRLSPEAQGWHSPCPPSPVFAPPKVVSLPAGWPLTPRPRGGAKAPGRPTLGGDACAALSSRVFRAPLQLLLVLRTGVQAAPRLQKQGLWLLLPRAAGSPPSPCASACLPASWPPPSHCHRLFRKQCCPLTHLKSFKQHRKHESTPSATAVQVWPHGG